MAQVVGYWQDNVVFTEGPFVIVNANGWRIEVEQKDLSHPVMTSVYSGIDRIIDEKLGFHGKTNDRKQIETICDALNQMVRDGEIVLDGNYWRLKTG